MEPDVKHNVTDVNSAKAPEFKLHTKETGAYQKPVVPPPPCINKPTQSI